MSYKPKTHQERVIHRMKIVQGHLKKVMQMTEDGQYCIDIIHQSQAIQKALREIDHLIMEDHLQTCAADAIRKGEQERAINEIMQVLKKTN